MAKSLELTKEQYQMFKENLPLVRYVLKETNLMSCDTVLHSFDDVENLGRIGLANACKTYTQGKGTFSTYAFTCIRNAIVDDIRRERPAKKTGVESFEKIGEMHEEIAFGAYDDELANKSLYDTEIYETLISIAKKADSKCVKLGITFLLKRNFHNDSDEKIASDFKLDQRTVRSYISRATAYLSKHPYMQTFRNR